MVKTYVLDCRQLLLREQAHDHLAHALELPAYYGRNLDALFDCLTALGPCLIVLQDAALLAQAGGYSARLLAAIEQAALENPNLHLQLEQPLP